MTVRLDKQDGQARQVFTPSREEPVAIFLPQHRPGRMRGPSLPVVAAAIGTVVALGAGLAYMMPFAPQGAGAPLETVAAATEAPVARSAAAPAVSEAASAGQIPTPADPAPPAAAQEADPVEPAPVETAALADAAPAETAPVEAAAADIPSGDDPRWAKVEAVSSGAALQAVKKLVIKKAARSEEAGPDVLAYADGSAPTDPEETSAVVRRPMQIVLPAEPPTVAEPATRQVAVRAAVNMRSGPGSNNGVILVIPRQAKVELHGCDQWCKVGYDGRIGYIYKSFVPGQGGSARAASPARAKAEPTKTVAVVSTVDEPEPDAPASQANVFEHQRERR